ncbi:MAG: glycosyltransferase [Gammaproteobacteria bacterium]|nr:MAG: glycosyltransferase [Gammaproteobacteria bacterium]
MAANKRLLMIAYHYPPCHGSSGLQRTLAFTRYLTRYGWDPALLTVSVGAYEKTSNSLMNAVPADMPIERVMTLDIARHLSLSGRYPASLAVPDRWVSWRLAAIRKVNKLVNEFRPDAIWSTYPIATAHMIGSFVARKSGLPWVADMRDPMVEYDPYTDTHFPESERIRRSRLRIEKNVVEGASKIIFCTEGARSICLDRYGSHQSDNYHVVPNGYDDAAFVQAEHRLKRSRDVAQTGYKLLHSGTVYPDSDRGPEALFEAIHNLSERDVLPPGFRLTLRATGHDDYLERLIKKFKIDGLVELAPMVTYQLALDEMLNSDALLVIQGPSSNPAIPAKLYEYFRARKPILGLLHPEGDTSALLQSLNAGVVAPLDDPGRIAAAMQELLSCDKRDRSLTVSDRDLPKFSRETQTGDLARVLNSL